MNSTVELPDGKRPYRQTARAAAAEATARRILAAFRERLERLWFDEIRLDEVAQAAGVTVQTVIRRFGGKEGLLEATADQIGQEVMATRATTPGDAAAAARAVIEDYERTADLILRILAQEDRFPALRRLTDIGRAGHREWIAEVFAARLAELPADATRRRLDALVVATDIYIWKLIRRDMGRPIEELQDLMTRSISAALDSAASSPTTSPETI